MTMARSIVSRGDGTLSSY